MSKLSTHRVLILGLLSPFLAHFLYVLVYSLLTQFSPDREKDWLFRVAVSALAMTVPFLITLFIAVKAYRRQALSLSGSIGLAVAVLSLALVWKPVSDGIARSKQIRNLAMRDVPAPLFDTPDITGKSQRLVDHSGEVVLVNIWATWCEPCRSEMPNLERLYQQRKPQGFVIFGMSDEPVDVQRKFLQQIPVSYPLLTLQGTVPGFYRDIARYPAIFLIDRRGRLQPAPGPDQPFENVQAAVDTLFNNNPK